VENWSILVDITHNIKPGNTISNEGISAGFIIEISTSAAQLQYS